MIQSCLDVQLSHSHVESGHRMTKGYKVLLNILWVHNCWVKLRSFSNIKLNYVHGGLQAAKLILYVQWGKMKNTKPEGHLTA